MTLVLILLVPLDFIPYQFGFNQFIVENMSSVVVRLLLKSCGYMMSNIERIKSHTYLKSRIQINLYVSYFVFLWDDCVLMSIFLRIRSRTGMYDLS